MNINLSYATLCCFLLCFEFGCGAMKKDAERREAIAAATTTAPAFKMTSVDLWREFHEDRDAFEARYAGKVVEVQGENIGKRTDYILLGPKVNDLQLRCYFEQMPAVVPDDSLINVVGYLEIQQGYPTLLNCR